MRRHSITAFAAALAVLALTASACGDDSADSDDSSSTTGTGPPPTTDIDPPPSETLPEPKPLDEPISLCDLLLPVEVDHYLQQDVGTPIEDQTTQSCEYAGALISQLLPASDSPSADIDLALLGKGSGEPLDIAGQTAAVASDSDGTSTLAVSVPRLHQTLSLTALNFADGMVPGTDELAVPGDDRVVAAQEAALQELAEIALIRLGVANAR